MKKIFIGLFALVSIGLGIGLGTTQTSPVVVRAEDEQTEVTEEVYECSVVIAETKHGEVTVDKEQGHVGDIVTITAKHDLMYVVGTVSVNGTALIESEETSGLFTFALVEGENKIEATFLIDEELLGEMSIIMDQALNKDWTHLFSVENVLRIVSFVLDGGILVAVARYFIKDKKLEKKVENKVEETIEKIIPESTRQIVLDNFEKVITPIFEQLVADNAEMKNALGTFAKCMALSQENSPEAKKAIVDELATVKIGSNEETFALVKQYIENLTAETKKAFDETLAQIQEIKNNSAKIIGEEAKEEVETISSVDDGTQI